MITDWIKFLEFLYDNGFKYIARRGCDYRGIYAFKIKPIATKHEDGDATYRLPGEPDKQFYVYINEEISGFDLVEPGECVEIANLLASKQEVDAVNHPKHYQLPSERESIDVMREILTEEEFRGWCKGNALKYIFREGKKDDAVQDIKKAGKFLEFLTENNNAQIIDER